MAQGRQPILRGTGQSDADMQGFNILDVGSVGDIQSSTLIVDPTLLTEIGIRGSGLPFRTLGAAVTAALPGDLIFLRPGIHAFDGIVDIFHLTGLRIMGYGAIIKSLSEVNETIKITVRSSDVTIEGIEFDGGFSAPGNPSDVGGCISITETDVTIRNCFIHSQNGYGIHCPLHYDGVVIEDCLFQTCSSAVFAEADTDTTVDTEGFWFKRNKVQHNRTFGVGLTGPGPDSTHFITGIQIANNEFSGNDTDVTHAPVVSATFACQGVQIYGNYIENESSGINLGQVKDISISDNHMKGVTGAAITLTGCVGAKIGNNLIDGRNSAGSPATANPILISGQYATPNDAGAFVITGNSLLYLKTNSIAVSVSNATGLVLSANQIQGTISLIAMFSVVVNGNNFNIPQTTQAILIDASNRGSGRISIIGNRFTFSGASINRCITTVDATATGISDVLISSNATPVGTTFAIATYSHSGPNVPTNVILIGNVPEAATSSATGWANVGQNQAIGRVFVSQSRGNNATGARASRNLKFSTINAAITAATSGDVVIVEDGTFNELIDAKDGITLRFLDPAILRCTSTSGCIRSTAVSQVFNVYHEHTPIVCTQNTTTAVAWSHANAILSLHASIEHTGSGTLPTALLITDGTVEVWGHILSLNSVGVSMLTGNPTFIIHGGFDEHPVIDGGSTALSALKGVVKVTGGTINGLVQLNLSALSFVVFKRCTFSNTGANPAINIAVVGATKPILRECVLVAGSSATQSIAAGSAQTIKLYGQTVANKGSDPPTNVTFQGGGTYDVDANVSTD